MLVTFLVNLLFVGLVLWGFWHRWEFISVKENEDGTYKVMLRQTRRMFPRPTRHLFVGRRYDGISGGWFDSVGEGVDPFLTKRIEKAIEYASVTGKIKSDVKSTE